MKSAGDRLEILIRLMSIGILSLDQARQILINEQGAVGLKLLLLAGMDDDSAFWEDAV